MSELCPTTHQATTPILDELQELSIEDFAKAEFSSWLTTPDKDLVAAQAPYVVAGSVTGTIPSRYSIGRPNESSLDQDPTLALLDIRYKDPRNIQEADYTIGGSNNDAHEARYGESAFSELTTLYLLTKPAMAGVILESLDTAYLEPLAVAQLQSKARIAEYIVAYRRRQRYDDEVAARLKKAGVGAEPVMSYGPCRALGHGGAISNNAAYWVTRRNYEG